MNANNRNRIRGFAIKARDLRDVLSGDIRVFGWPKDAEVVNVFPGGAEWSNPMVIMHVTSGEYQEVGENTMISVCYVELEAAK